MKIIVYHSSYGCETGCCGHVIEVTEGPVPRPESNGRGREFDFNHPYEATDDEKRVWAQDWVRAKFGEEHVKDLDWDNCDISND